MSRDVSDIFTLEELEQRAKDKSLVEQLNHAVRTLRVSRQRLRAATDQRRGPDCESASPTNVQQGLQGRAGRPKPLQTTTDASQPICGR